MNNLEHILKPVMGLPKIDGTEALYVNSPCCNTNDSKFRINWSKGTWICNHQNTCGQRGNLYQLAKLLNVDIPRDNQSNNYYKPYKPPEQKQYIIPTVKTEPIVIEETKAVNLSDRVKHLEALFSDDADLIVCKNANYAEIIKSNLTLLEYDEDNYTHFKVNHGGAKAEDIKEFTYTLVECDEIADLNKQKEYLLGLNLPIASLVWSGNKSLHAVVKIQAIDRIEYNRRVELLHKICAAVNFPIDKTKDPCRYTRLAGALNPATGNYQQLIDTNIGAESWNEWEVYQLPRLEVTKHTVNTATFESKPVEAGFSSGFLTHDYNDSGLKAGGLTLLTGKRNQGKTTFARQIMIATARQQMSVYAYMGEGEMEREKGYLERLISFSGELEAYDNTYGRTDYMATKPVKDRFDNEIAPYIDFYNKPLDMKETVFKSILKEMTIKARQGTVLFVIDNMMKLTADQKEVFKAQQVIVAKLKEFAVFFKVHIILIAHPKKDGTSISGAMEQENTADTILKFTRLFSTLTADQAPEHLVEQEYQNITAMVYNEKVRDGGTMRPMFMAFDPVRQANIDVVYMPDLFRMAQDYKIDGHFSRPMA
jgi:KaiC/GvpD/RAD55 family RecA-like ATPase